MDEVMKAGQGMRDLVHYMDLDTGMREGVAKGWGFWKAALIIMCVFLVMFVVLRIAVRKVADQRTRRIIQEGMEDDSPLAESDRATSDSEPNKR